MAAAKRKLDEGSYFLERLFEDRGGWNLHDRQRAFQSEFNALVTATRSVVQVLGKGFGHKFFSSVMDAWESEERRVFDEFTYKRNTLIHDGVCAADCEIKMVPAHELPVQQRSPLDPFMVQQQLPGCPPPKHAKLVFTVSIAEVDEDAIAFVRTYLNLARRLLDAADAQVRSSRRSS